MYVVRWFENYVRFEKSYGNWLPDGQNSVRFNSQCKIWRNLILSCEIISVAILSLPLIQVDQLSEVH